MISCAWMEQAQTDTATPANTRNHFIIVFLPSGYRSNRIGRIGMLHCSRNASASVDGKLPATSAPTHTTIARGVARGKDHRLLLFPGVALDLSGPRTLPGNRPQTRRHDRSETGGLRPHLSRVRRIAGRQTPARAASLSPDRTRALAQAPRRAD